MPWGARQWLRLTREATKGTFDSGALAANIMWMRLDRDNAFTPEPTPLTHIVRSADGGNEPVQEINAHRRVEGTLTTLLYPSQTAGLLAWALNLSSNDLQYAWTADHFDSVRTRRYLGGHVESLTLEASAGSEEGAVRATLGLVFYKEDTSDPTLTEPAFSAFPTELPWNFAESSGGFKLGTAGAVRSNYNMFRFSVNNVLNKAFEEGPTVPSLDYCGRSISLATDLRYAASTDRTAFEARSNLDVEFKFTRSASSLTLDIYTRARIGELGRSLPLGGIGRQTVSLYPLRDPTPGANVAFTYVP